MTYHEAIEYLESFINYEKVPVYPYKESLKLERIRDFLFLIGNPQDSLRCIHVAGTKGKGSTCAFIAYILREAGYKIGLYTSPHLSDFRERIRILSPGVNVQGPGLDFEGMIAQKELIGLIRRLRPAIQKYNRNSKYGPLSFFEVYTALAFVYFKEKKIDFAVLETGLGGRLDATNAANAFVSVVTPISLEHTDKLGNTLREIAVEKAGIIKKRHQIVVSAPQGKEAREVIRKKCKETGAKLLEVGKEIKYQKQSGSFNVKGIFSQYRNLKIRLIGEHQLINATCAIAAVEALRNYGIKISAGSIQSGLRHAFWPGRCEVAGVRPCIVLDGAQNEASAQVLKKAVKQYFDYKKLILVLGVSRDKDIKSICDQLSDLADQVVLTKADNPRATPPELLASYFDAPKKHLTKNTAQALRLAKELSSVNDLILVCGSLFVVGEARGYLKNS